MQKNTDKSDEDTNAVLEKTANKNPTSFQLTVATAFQMSTPNADKYRRGYIDDGDSGGKVTPASSLDPVKSRRQAYWKKKRAIHYSSSDEESIPPPVRRSRRNTGMNRSKSSNTNKAKSSIFIKPHSVVDDDEVQIMKVEKAQMLSSTNAVRNNVNNDNTNTSCAYSGSSSTTTRQIRGIECLGFVDPSPPFSQQSLCNSCGNRGYACHNKVYSTYCTKACLDYLQNNKEGWWSGFDPDTMEQVFVTAYNEKRRVELEEMHGYYSPGRVEVPQCMKDDCMIHAIGLGDNPKLCDDLSKHNKGGYGRWLEAKKNFRS